MNELKLYFCSMLNNILVYKYYSYCRWIQPYEKFSTLVAWLFPPYLKPAKRLPEILSFCLKKIYNSLKNFLVNSKNTKFSWFCHALCLVLAANVSSKEKAHGYLRTTGRKFHSSLLYKYLIEAQMPTIALMYPGLLFPIQCKP